MNGDSDVTTLEEAARPPDAGGRAVAEVGLVLAVSGGFILARSVFSLRGGGPIGVVAACLTAWWLLRRAGRGAEAIGLVRPARWWKAALAAVVGSVAILMVTGALDPIVSQFTGRTQNLSVFANLPGNVPVYLFWLAIAWSTAAFGEEILFRGFILGRLTEGFGGGRGAVAAALVLQAVVFGLGHAYQGPAGMIMVFVVGLGMGVLFLATGRNLWAAILAHGLIDTLGLTMLFLGKDL